MKKVGKTIVETKKTVDKVITEEVKA